MNRQITGWLAWGALALVIAVPSADIVFSTPDDEVVGVAVVSTPALLIEVPDLEKTPIEIAAPLAGDVAEQPVIIVTPEPVEAEIAEVVSPVVEVEVAMEPAPLQVLTAPDNSEVLQPLQSVPVEDVLRIAEPAVVEVAEEVIEIAEPIAAPVVIHVADKQPVKAVRIVAGPGAVEASTTDDTPAIVISAEPVTEPSKVLADVALAEALGAEETPIVVAAVDRMLVVLDTIPLVTPPVPMPASMRPSEPVQSTVAIVTAPEDLQQVPFAGSTFEDDARQTVNRLRSSRTVNRPIFDEDEFWGDGPEYRGSEQLDDFNIGEFNADQPDANGDFNRRWNGATRPPGFRRSGSFEEQLPAYHGNGVRMDLLQ